MTGDIHTYVSTSNYLGEPGQIWLTRLVPNIDDIYNYQISISTPYVIIGQDKQD